MLTVIGAYTVSAFASTDVNSTDIISGNAITASESEGFVQAPQAQTSIMMGQDFIGFGRGPGGCGGPNRGFMIGGMSNIEVSSEFTAKVNEILENDTDVANLVSQGYNVTAIRPVIKTTIQGDGMLASKASSATVFLQGTSGFATANVDIENAKVTQIIAVTRTVIDKSIS